MVGIQYLITVFVLFLVGGVASWMIRLEQAQSGAKVFTPSTYNTIVGMHGIIMIATTIIMISSTFGNYIIPIIIGAKDMAFPRINALSYWTLFPAVPILLSSIVLGGFPTGWTGYAPLADQAALGMDAYCVVIILFGTSIALGAMNMAATVITMRAPGMTWSRLPIMVWGVDVLNGPRTARVSIVRGCGDARALRPRFRHGLLPGERRGVTTGSTRSYSGSWGTPRCT